MRARRCARDPPRSIRSGWTSAIGWTPICSLMMNSMRARPTPALGVIAVRNARSGLPRFDHDLRSSASRDRRRRRARLRTEFRRHRRFPISPPAQEIVTSAPVLRTAVAFSAPTTAGTPSSRATIAAWQVRPPWSVTMAPAVFITGSQSGLVERATSTSPGRKDPEVVGALDDAHDADRRSSRRPPCR